MSEWESLLRGYLAAGDAGELDDLNKYLHEDVIIHDPGSQTTHSLDQEKETWLKAREAMPRPRIEIKANLNPAGAYRVFPCRNHHWFHFCRCNGFLNVDTFSSILRGKFPLTCIFSLAARLSASLVPHYIKTM